MAIFPKIKVDSLSQTNEGVRIDARQTIYRDIDDVFGVEISPNIDGENDLPYQDVFEEGRFDKWFLDWSYLTAGTYNPTVRVQVTEGSEPEYKTISKSISIITPETDALFSNDDDIIQSEPDIYRYLPEGRTSFTFMHREAQRRILAYLDEQRIWKLNGERYTKTDLFDKEEFVHWSRFMVLEIIFKAKIVSTDDFFAVKASDYALLKKQAANRGTLRLSEDGVKEADLKYDKSNTMVIKR